MTENHLSLPAFPRMDIGRGERLYDDEPHTLAQLFINAERKHQLPKSLNYKRDGTWAAISSSELVVRAGNIALGLYSIGLRKVDKAALLSANSPEWTLADAGCQFCGVIDVPIYTTLAESSVNYILNDSEPRVFFLENKEMFNRVEDFLDECKSLETLVVFDIKGNKYRLVAQIK